MEFTPTPVNEFSLSLYKAVSSHKIADNSVVSPFSVFLTLLMCLFGAGGKTATQLANTLKIRHGQNETIYSAAKNIASQLSQLDLSPAVWSEANRIYLSRGFDLNLDYIAALGNAYQSSLSPVRKVDFSNPQLIGHINSWVANITHGLIKNLLEEGDINEDSKVLLVNALYFNAKWDTEFLESDTNDADFHSLSNQGNTTQVKMMNIASQIMYKYGINPHNISADTIELPYKGKHSAMTIILPHENSSLAQVEKKLNAKILQEIISSNNNYTTGNINLTLPRFYIKQKQVLNSYLIEMGAKNAFDSQLADFTLMADEQEGFYVGKVMHEAVINVTETGTEAAAATDIFFPFALPTAQNPIEFKCNRPFMFIIHEKITDNILFMGKYINPNN